MSVPKLRFKEFKGNWDRKKLNVLFDKITTKNTLGKCDNVISNSAQYGLVSQRNFFLKDIANVENTSNYYVIEHDDFVYNPRKSKEAPYGPFNRYMFNDTGIVSPLYTCLRRKSVDDLDFLMFYFKSGLWHRYMYANGNTGVRHDRVSITDDILMKLPVSLPLIGEQQKIADFLTAFDKRIAAQQNIIADLEETKKGLLQKIFSQEIRFKDDNGQDYPDWKKGKLSEIADFLQGLTYHPEDAVNTGKVVLRSSNIKNGQICYDNVVCVDMEIPDKLTLRENDVLMCVRNGSKKLVGKTAIITKKDLDNTWGAFMMILRAKENAGFLFQYLNSKYFFKEMFVDLGTATINQITKGMLQKCKMMIPSNAEQQKIAAFLSTFDKKITAERQILSDLQEIKRGLLQQMFV